MHEFSIARNIFDTVFQNIDKEDTVSKVTVEIGSFSGIESESIIFCWDILKENTRLKDSVIEVLSTDTTAECRKCGEIYTVRDYFFVCPECGSSDSEIIRGDKIILKSIEVEENG